MALRQRTIGFEPYRLGGRLWLTIDIAGDVDDAHVDRVIAAPVSTHVLGQVRHDAAHQLFGTRQCFGRWHVRHRRLMIEAGLRLMKRGAHRKDRAPMLYGAHPAGGEAAAVANALDVVNDLPLWVAGQQKVALQRVDRPVRVDG
jgi:hypothetical protein